MLPSILTAGSVSGHNNNSVIVHPTTILPKHYTNVTTAKLNFKKPVRLLTSFQKPEISIPFNLFQVCPSISTFSFALLLIPSFHVLSDYFMFP